MGKLRIVPAGSIQLDAQRAVVEQLDRSPRRIVGEECERLPQIDVAARPRFGMS